MARVPVAHLLSLWPSPDGQQLRTAQEIDDENDEKNDHQDADQPVPGSSHCEHETLLPDERAVTLRWMKVTRGSQEARLGHTAAASAHTRATFGARMSRGRRRGVES